MTIEGNGSQETISKSGTPCERPTIFVSWKREQNPRKLSSSAASPKRLMRQFYTSNSLHLVRSTSFVNSLRD